MAIVQSEITVKVTIIAKGVGGPVRRFILKKLANLFGMELDVKVEKAKAEDEPI